MFLVATRNFPPELGGMQNLMEGLSNALLNHGPVKVFADNIDNAEDYDQNSKLSIERVQGFKVFRKYRKANLIKDFIEHNDLRATFFDHWKSIENIDEDSLKKTKSFCLIHSKEINHPVGSSLNKRTVKALSKANYVIANSRFTKELAKKKGVKANDIKVINPGCNYPIPINEEAKEFAKKKYSNFSPKLITVSRLDGRKSHQNIIMTVKNLLPKFPSLKYISVGDGDERNNLEKLKKELGLEKEVELIYKTNEQEKVALIEQSDVFVMPSVVYKKSIEGFGVAYVEAASYGKPSIGGIYGGEGDAIKSGQTGYLCNGNDLNALYNTLLKILENNHHKDLGAKALEFSKDFNWSKIIKKYIELI
ncbi:glycosyltransferase family 4 protein [Pelagibacteraceae bacterium]|nr:glycosyltransferase family 4 protein [Pelagibacteraceae bacterium]MDC1158865.1 glycosyltransferase family 4 protein [Pelagibacteraceae bacterium]